MDPDDCFSLGHVSENPDDPLYGYNYMQAHRSCLPQWAELSQLLKLVEAAKESGRWRGPALDPLIGELETAARAQLKTPK